MLMLLRNQVLKNSSIQKFVHLHQEKALDLYYLWSLTLLLSVYSCLYLASFFERYLCIFEWFPIVHLFIFTSTILLEMERCSYGYLFTWSSCYYSCSLNKENYSKYVDLRFKQVQKVCFTSVTNYLEVIMFKMQTILLISFYYP